MRMLYTLFSLAAFGYGLYFLAEKNPDLKQKAEEFLDFRTTSALETRFDANQVMEIHQKKLLKEKGARFLDPELKFLPFLLMEAKYADSKGRTKESLILFDLTEGEMILDTNTWEKTHGFADCMINNVQQKECQILHILSEKGGSCEMNSLLGKLEIEMPILEALIQSCVRKNLIIQAGINKYRLHLENPKLTTIPETKAGEPLTTKTHKRVERAPKTFRPKQVERLAKVAFGETFSIRKSNPIYLPIHRIVVQKTDGSTQTFHYNALTGKELPPARFYQ